LLPQSTQCRLRAAAWCLLGYVSSCSEPPARAIDEHLWNRGGAGMELSKSIVVLI
jgi:hypothetical protein